jgi:hypothetical protein
MSKKTNLVQKFTRTDLKRCAISWFQYPSGTAAFTKILKMLFIGIAVKFLSPFKKIKQKMIPRSCQAGTTACRSWAPENPA